MKHGSSLMSSLRAKNEVAYNPETWDIWTAKSPHWELSHPRGLKATLTGTIVYIHSDIINCKPSTNYAILLRVSETTTGHGLRLEANLIDTIKIMFSLSTTGAKKYVFQTKNEITVNSLRFTIGSGSSGIVVIKDIRLFELPPNSLIAQDFDNLTAEQLDKKYPFAWM